VPPSDSPKTAIRFGQLHHRRPAVASSWSLWVLRVDDKVSEELSVWVDALTTGIDPGALIDLTGR
jgi:hypothetical protein